MCFTSPVGVLRIFQVQITGTRASGSDVQIASTRHLMGPVDTPADTGTSALAAARLTSSWPPFLKWPVQIPVWWPFQKHLCAIGMSIGSTTFVAPLAPAMSSRYGYGVR